MSTLTEYVESQETLIQEAAEALPHSFSQCTYTLGPIRQAVYLCLTCPETRGICSACSIACHTDHDQVELFPKRNFRCDCPTIGIAHSCTLHAKLEDENETNQYGQNFQNKFCRCGRAYDATKERETMIQCLSCEDWFHESCCNLRERPPSREPSPEPDAPSSDRIDDNASEASSSGLPPPLIAAAEYESYICTSCVTTIPILQRWAGTPGIMMVIRDTPNSPWKVIPDTTSPERVPTIQPIASDTNSSSKRSRSPSVNEEREQKRQKNDDLTTDVPTGSFLSKYICLAPSQNPLAAAVFSPREGMALEGAKDIFLTEGFRERWCRCNDCLPKLRLYPFLLEEETTYEPPEDPDSGLSLEQLGMRALERIPRDRAIDGIMAFNSLRDNLMSYLRPFAQEGKVVNEADIKSFFDRLQDSHTEGVN